MKHFLSAMKHVANFIFIIVSSTFFAAFGFTIAFCQFDGFEIHFLERIIGGIIGAFFFIIAISVVLALIIPEEEL